MALLQLVERAQVAGAKHNHLTEKALGRLLYGIVMSTQPLYIRDSYEVKVSGRGEISDQWIEFQAKPQLQADKDDQFIMLELEAPYRDDLYKEGKGPNKGQGILMADGEVINPEVQVIDQYGNKFDLVYRGARRSFWPIYSLPYPNQWPRDREYKTVRIRSPRPIKCKAVYWFCESNKDMK